jgi:hypothetical protein
MELNDLEKAVLEKLLEGSHPVLEALRRQLPGLSVEKRQQTGAGFYTEFAKGSAAPVLLTGRKIRFGDVQASIDSLKLGAGFVLFVDDGLIHMLEGYSYEEPWPETIGNFVLTYSTPDRTAALAKLD